MKVVRNVFTFIGAFLLSMLIAGMIAVQIAISTGAREEFIAVFMVLELFGLATIIVFAFVYGCAKSARALWKAALVMFGLVAVLCVGLWVVSFAIHRSGAYAITDAKIVVPAVLLSGIVIVIQYWPIASRWRRTHPVADPAVA